MMKFLLKFTDGVLKRKQAIEMADLFLSPIFNKAVVSCLINSLENSVGDLAIVGFGVIQTNKILGDRRRARVVSS